VKKRRKVKAITISPKAWEPIVEKIKESKEKRRINHLKRASNRTGVKANKIVLASSDEEILSKPKEIPAKKRRLFVRLVQGGAPGLGKMVLT